MRNMSELHSMSKLPPQAVELERAVLGAVMLGAPLSEVTSVICPSDLYAPENVLIMEAMVELDNKNKAIDMLTVVQQLRSAGKLDSVGGSYAISKMTENNNGGVNIEEHSYYILQAALARDQIKFGNEVVNMGYDQMVDPLETTEFIGVNADRLSSKMSLSKSRDMGSIVADVIAKAHRASMTVGGITGLTTGIAERDAIYGGRHGGHMIIKAGRPAMGKTADALCEAIHIGMQGKNALFFSLEMGSDELTQRAMSVISGVTLDQIQKGRMNDDEWARVDDAGSRLAGSGLSIVDDCYSLSSIRAEARKRKNRGGLDAVYVDYMQLVVHSLGGNRNRENEVSEISRSMKLMAKSLNVPVVVLSQLNRATEMRADKKPTLSSLRESGSQEQDADAVEFLYRPEYYGITDVEGFSSTNGLAFCIVAKNRHGAVGEIPMRFHHVNTKFGEWNESISPLPQPSGYRPIQPRSDSQPF